VLVVLIASLAGVIGTVVRQVGKYARHRADLLLKRELVERGLSAEEIERIVAARPPSENESHCQLVKR
jgi:hypothetical protein